MAQKAKNLPASAGDARDRGLIPGSGRPLEKGMVAHSSILAMENAMEARGGRMGDLAGSALAVSYRRSGQREEAAEVWREMIRDRKSTRLNSSHRCTSRMPSSA